MRMDIFSTPRVIGIIVMTVIIAAFGVLHYLQRKKRESKGISTLPAKSGENSEI